jgi:hypothetical protein
LRPGQRLPRSLTFIGIIASIFWHVHAGVCWGQGWGPAQFTVERRPREEAAVGFGVSHLAFDVRSLSFRSEWRPRLNCGNAQRLRFTRLGSPHERVLPGLSQGIVTPGPSPGSLNMCVCVRTQPVVLAFQANVCILDTCVSERAQIRTRRGGGGPDGWEEWGGQWGGKKGARALARTVMIVYLSYAFAPGTTVSAHFSISHSISHSISGSHVALANSATSGSVKIKPQPWISQGSFGLQDVV